MDFLDVLKRAFALARQSQAVWAYVAYFVGLLVGLGVVVLAALPLFKGSPAVVTIALVFAIGMLWVAFAFLGNLAITTSLIFQVSSAKSLRESFETIRPRFFTFIWVSLVLAALLGALAIPFLLLRLVLPSQEILLSVLHSLLAFLATSALVYALYFSVLRKQGVLDSLSHSLSLFQEKTVDVMLSVLLASLAKLVVLVITAIILVVFVFVGVNVFAALKTSVFGVLLLALIVLLSLAVLALGAAFGEVWEIISLRLFFDSLAEKVRTESVGKVSRARGRSRSR